VEIHIVQGERAMASDNKSLGRFILDGIPPAPRGMPQVEVTFDVDANGILNVKAKDKATNKEQSIRIEARSGLSDADIERMKKEAETNADTDKKTRDLAEVRNMADSVVYTAEKSLAEHGAKIPEDVKKSIQDAVAKVKETQRGGDTDGIRTATQALSTEIQKIGQYMQQNSGQSTDNSSQQGGGQKPPETGTEGNVRDV
ncbi:Hsp70 family protein, partial [Candidatus Kaiserbacteria bacterium]|nr:Hsp70 family protein [Candidatus Kaiserbacteria bacterium]